MTRDESLLLQAMVDGELDAPSQHAFERRLAAEPDLATEYARLVALRSAMRRIPQASIPDNLRARIARMGQPERTAEIVPMPVRGKPAFSVSSWGAMAATVAALSIGASGGWFAGSLSKPADFENAIVAAHVRGLVASRPVDVVSTDQHTVKPWFSGKLAIAPVVVDLQSAGFALEGGRIDMVDGVAEPTLVYRHGAHTVSLTRLPPAAGDQGVMPGRRTIAGHSTLIWRSGDQSYVAVSDAAPAELDALREAFDKARISGG